MTVEDPDLCINDCGGSRFVYKWLWRGPIWGSVFHLGGSSYSTETPCALESHLQIVKIDTPKILKRESLFSEEKKPENHFFASKSFAIFIMTFDVLFGVRNWHFWTKWDRYFHFLTFFDTFWTSLCINDCGRDRFVYKWLWGIQICV